MCKNIQTDIHHIIIYISKTVNILNAHPNKEMLPFLPTCMCTHTHTHARALKIYHCLLLGKEANQLGSKVEGKLAFYHMLFCTIWILYQQHISHFTFLSYQYCFCPALPVVTYFLLFVSFSVLSLAAMSNCHRR